MRALPLYLISAMVIVSIAVELWFYDKLLLASKIPLITALVAALFISGSGKK